MVTALLSILRVPVAPVVVLVVAGLTAVLEVAVLEVAAVPVLVAVLVAVDSPVLVLLLTADELVPDFLTADVPATLAVFGE